MDSLKDLTNSINQNKDLSDTQIKICIDLLISEKVEVKDKEEFQIKRYREHLAAILIQNAYTFYIIEIR